MASVLSPFWNTSRYYIGLSIQFLVTDVLEELCSLADVLFKHFCKQKGQIIRGRLIYGLKAKERIFCDKVDIFVKYPYDV